MVFMEFSCEKHGLHYNTKCYSVHIITNAKLKIKPYSTFNCLKFTMTEFHKRVFNSAFVGAHLSLAVMRLIIVQRIVLRVARGTRQVGPLLLFAVIVSPDWFMFLSPLFGTEMSGGDQRLPRGLISLTQVLAMRMAKRKPSRATGAISQSRVISQIEGLKVPFCGWDLSRVWL